MKVEDKEQLNADWHREHLNKNGVLQRFGYVLLPNDKLSKTTLNFDGNNI